MYEELSAGRKWLTVIVMALVTAAAVFATKTYGQDLASIASAYGPPDRQPQFYLWIGMCAVCIGLWLATYGLCAAIQRSFNVWGGFWLLPVLLLATGGVNFGPQYAPQAISYVHYKLFEEADQKAIAAVKADNVAQVIALNDACGLKLDKLGFPEFMMAPSLGAPHGLEKARVKIKLAREVVQSCQAQDKIRVDKFKQAITNLNISDAAKQKALAEFNNSSDGAEADRARLARVENALLDEFERVLADLAANRDGWYANGFKIMFVSRHDYNRFEKHSAVIAKLLDEGKAIDRRLQAKRDKTEYVIVKPGAGR